MFATWTHGSNFVTLSETLKLFLGLHSCCVDPINFLSKVQVHFGTFLTNALKDFDKQNGARKILKKSLKNSSDGKLYALTITYYSDSQTYIFEQAEANVATCGLEAFSILNSIPICVWAKDKNGKLVYCNDAYAGVLETPKDEAVKRNILWSSVAASYKGGKGSGRADMDSVVIDGRLTFFDISETEIGNTGISLCCAIDSTKFETVLREYEKYKTESFDTLNSLSSPIAVLDEHTKVVFANDAFLHMFKVDEKTINNDIMTSELLDYLRDNRVLLEMDNFQEFKDIVLGMFTTVLEPRRYFFSLSNGKTFNVIVSPYQIGGLIFVFEDITDKIALERDYNALSAIQKETLDHLIEGILVFGADNKIKMTNPALRSIWTDNEYDDLHINEFFEINEAMFTSEEESQEIRSELIAHSTSKRELYSGEIKQQSDKLIEYAYVPLPEGLNLVRFVDATDKYNLQKAMDEKVNLIEQIDKLKSDLISNISTEFNTPIDTIRSFADILIKQYFGELNDKQSNYCTGIINAANRLYELVESMINLASIESGHMKLKYAETTTQIFASQCASLFSQKLSDKNIQLIQEIENPEEKIIIDTKGLEKVVFYFLSEAMNYTKEGGTISFTIHTSSANNNYIDIKITDSSISEYELSDRQISAINKLFAGDVSDLSIKGTLDFMLAYSSNIVRLNGGKIRMTYIETAGTQVKITIPKRPEVVYS